MLTFPIQKRYIQGPDFISLDHGNLNNQLAFARLNKVDGFVIAHDWTKAPFPNLDFLAEANVRGIVINFDAVKDSSIINSFYGMEVLQFIHTSYPTSAIDLSNFKNLRVLDANWNKNLKGFETLSNVIRLKLWGYKPTCRNLEELTNCNNLVYMNLVQPQIDSLDGIENLARLKEVDLGNVRSLKRFLSKETKFTAPIEELTISLCPHFDIDTIPTISTLKHLRFSQFGKKQTLKNLLAKFPNIESIGFTQSELIDGNLDYIFDHPTLKKVIIDHKKHYNLKEKEIQQRLDERHQGNFQ